MQLLHLGGPLLRLVHDQLDARRGRPCARTCPDERRRVAGRHEHPQPAAAGHRPRERRPHQPHRVRHRRATPDRAAAPPARAGRRARDPAPTTDGCATTIAVRPYRSAISSAAPGVSVSTTSAVPSSASSARLVAAGQRLRRIAAAGARSPPAAIPEPPHRLRPALPATRRAAAPGPRARAGRRSRPRSRSATPRPASRNPSRRVDPDDVRRPDGLDVGVGRRHGEHAELLTAAGLERDSWFDGHGGAATPSAVRRPALVSRRTRRTYPAQQFRNPVPTPSEDRPAQFQCEPARTPGAGGTDGGRSMGINDVIFGQL